MKNNKHIMMILILLFTSISFIACGGSNTVEESMGDSFEKISISKACTSPDRVDEYITLKSGDKIVKDEEDSQISILQDENAVKKVCLNRGVAHISRAIIE